MPVPRISAQAAGKALAEFAGGVSQGVGCAWLAFPRISGASRMQRHWLVPVLASMVLAAICTGDVMAQSAKGPYARIAILRPHEGHTVDFEAGYIRHLEWHRQAQDPWTWYGWNIWAGDRQRWFVYATFGHASTAFDKAVLPAEDERDNIINVLPHAQFLGNALYEFLPALSRGTGEPTPAARLELTTVELPPGSGPAFETALRADAARLQMETLWFRMVAGGPAPRYVRLRPRPNLQSVIEGASEQVLGEKSNAFVSKITVEVLTLRPTLSYALPARQ
jgi:hypothetical protein